MVLYLNYKYFDKGFYKDFWLIFQFPVMIDQLIVLSAFLLEGKEGPK